MSPDLLFWTLALVNMALAFAAAAAGVRAARGGRFRTHKRRMLTAVGLIVLFVAAYGVKLAVLGREDLTAWERTDVVVLRVHETFIAALLLGGAFALYFARGTRLTEGEEVAAYPAGRRRHRLFGKIALAAFALALFTAGLLYLGMIERARGTEAPPWMAERKP